MRFFSLKYKLLLLICIPLLLISIVMGVLDYYSEQKKLRDHYRELSRQTESNIINTVNMVDKSYRMIESFLALPMEQTFALFEEEYERSGNNPDKMDLLKVKKAAPEDVDLYIIEDGVITHTTFPRVLDFDFKLFPDVFKRLEIIRQSDLIVHDRLAVEFATGNVRLWSYSSSPDHKYIFELAIDYARINEIAGSMDLPDLVKDLKNYNQTLEEVRLYDGLGLEVSGGLVYLDGSILDQVKKDGVVELHSRKEKTITRYIYVKLEHDEIKPSNPSKVVKLVYNISHIDRTLKKMLISIIGANIVYFFIFTLLVLAFVQFITKPIINLNNKIKEFSHKHFEPRVTAIPNDEIGELGVEFNKMADIIQGYTENLEFLVEDKTIQLKSVLEELREEFEMAQKIQLSIIPTEFPLIEDIHLSGRYVPMKKLGGDYYDAFRIGKNKVVLIIADVCGHGVPAALITTMAKISFNSRSKANKGSEEVVRLVNEMLFNVIGNKEFVTVFYGILDFEKMELDYTNAGHCCIYLMQKEGGLHKLEATSPFIGYSMKAPFEAKKIKIEKHDKIILYTDGLIDVKNQDGTFFSEERLIDIIKSSSQLKPDQVVNRVFEEVAAFRQTGSYDDDMALLIGEVQ